MPLFARNKQQAPTVQSCIGVDIGTTGVKLVEISAEDGKARLLTYAYAEAEDPLKAVAGLSDKTALTAQIQALCKQAGVRGTRAVAALPSAQVFHAVVSVPTTKEAAELQSLMEVQAAKLLPMQLSEVVLDSTKIDEVDGYTRLLITAAPKTLIAEYEQVFQGTSLTLSALETETAALSRSLLGEERGVVLLVDLGGDRTVVSVLEHGIPMLVRSSKTGAMNLTRMFAEMLRVEPAEGESMKRDLRISEQMPLPAPLISALQPVLHEIRYTRQLHQDQRGTTVEKIILTGGGGMLSGLSAYLAKELNMNTYVGDPWLRVAAPREAREMLEDVGARLSVAVGLGMRVVDEV